MSNPRFVSATRFFTEALLFTAFLCGVAVTYGHLESIHLSPWWLLLAAPFFFGLGCAGLMLSGSVMVEKE